MPFFNGSGKCDYCENVLLPPNDCTTCNKCGKRVHRGMLLWPRHGGICSDCYFAEKEAEHQDA